MIVNKEKYKYKLNDNTYNDIEVNQTFIFKKKYDKHTKLSIIRDDIIKSIIKINFFSFLNGHQINHDDENNISLEEMLINNKIAMMDENDALILTKNVSNGITLPKMSKNYSFNKKENKLLLIQIKKSKIVY